MLFDFYTYSGIGRGVLTGSGVVDAELSDNPSNPDVYYVQGISGTINGYAITGLVNPDSHPGYGGGNQVYPNGYYAYGGYYFFGRQQTYSLLDENGFEFSTAADTFRLDAFIMHPLAGPSFDGYYILDHGGNDPDAYTEAEFVAECLAGGSRVRTARGDVAVEALRVGDLADTAGGGRRPIVWLGHRTIERPAFAQNPVRVAAHAFGPDLPARDLMLSPGHPVLVGADADEAGGWLVPVMCLINGTTIERLSVDTVTYWHVELDVHDVLLAEGLPAESYIDLGSRAWFDGADGVLHDPDLVLAGQPGRCRPVAIDGPVVEAARRRLDAMFATRLANACAWPAADGDPPPA